MAQLALTKFSSQVYSTIWTGGSKARLTLYGSIGSG